VANNTTIDLSNVSDYLLDVLRV